MIEQIGAGLDLDLSIALWDGSRIPLGANVTSDLAISIAGPGVIASLLRRPTLDRVIRHYLRGHLDFEGGTLIDIGEQLVFKRSRSVLRKIGKWDLLKTFVPFLFVKPEKLGARRRYGADETGGDRGNRDEKSFIQFHYDVSNAFYRLFLDRRMIYTCGYFRDWNNGLDQAQEDNLEMICRKLRLRPGARFLDIGCAGVA